jgi:hypothetical protein
LVCDHLIDIHSHGINHTPTPTVLAVPRNNNIGTFSKEKKHQQCYATRYIPLRSLSQTGRSASSQGLDPHRHRPSHPQPPTHTHQLPPHCLCTAPLSPPPAAHAPQPKLTKPDLIGMPPRLPRPWQLLRRGRRQVCRVRHGTTHWCHSSVGVSLS